MRERATTRRRDAAPKQPTVDRRPRELAGGTPLDSAARAFMEPRFGHHFGDVRVFSGAQAARLAAAAGAEALTVGRDVVFGAGHYAPDTPRGRLLLAHELTHVVQNDRATGAAAGPPAGAAPATLSDPADAAEREASTVAHRVAEGGEAGSVAAAPSAGISRGVLGWLEENIVDPVAGAASDVGSAVADTASSVGSTIADGASTAWGGISDAGSAIYSGMKQNAGYVRDGVSYANQGIDWLEAQASGGAHWLADQADGIPVLEQLADGGAWVVDQQAQLTGGVLKGATSLVGGIGQMVADPVDTVIGLEAMAEHIRPIPGMPNPLQVLHGLYNAATTDATLGGEMNRTLNPLETMQGDARFGEALVGGLLEPYQESWHQGKYAEVGGRAIFDIGSLFLGAGEANAAVKGAEGAALVTEVARGAEAASVVSDAARAAEVGDVARAAELTDAARASEVASDAARTADAAELARGAGEAGELKNMGTGGRNAAPLSEAEIAQARQKAIELGMPEDKLQLSLNDPASQTSWGQIFGEERLYIADDVKPALGGQNAAGEWQRLTPNQQVSIDGAMSHEIVGHREADLAGRSQTRSYAQYMAMGDEERAAAQALDVAKDEAQASLRAAKFAPGLSNAERMTLFKDAMSRLAKEGLGIDDVPGLDLFLGSR